MDFVIGWGKEKGPESFWIRGPWGPNSVLTDRAPSGRGTKCGIPRGALGSPIGGMAGRAGGCSTGGGL